MIVFVLSTSYLTRAAIHFLKLFSFESKICINICILGDRHTIDEFPDDFKNILIIKNNFKECLAISDFCLIIKAADSSNPKLNMLFSSVQKSKLPYYCIELPCNLASNIDEICCLKPSPVVLIINYGEYTQQYCTELALAYSFYKRGIGVYQRFSLFTDRFINGIKSIISFKEDTVSEKEISVISYQNTLFEDYENDNKIREIIHRVNPQYVILSTNNGVVITEEIRKHIYYLYGVNVDCIVRSVFTPLLVADKTIPMVVDYSFNSNDLFAEDSCLAEKLFRNIEQKLVIPKGICLI